MMFSLRGNRIVQKPNGQHRVRRQILRPLCIARPIDGSSLSSTVTPDDILQVPTLWDKLSPRPSPFAADNNRGGGCVSDNAQTGAAEAVNSGATFVGNRDLVTLHTLKFESPKSAGFLDTDAGDYKSLPPWSIRAGPRGQIYHDPADVTAAIVTCGGLCPGLNDVVQNIVYTLLDYGVPEENIIGIRYGLRGFYSRNLKPVSLKRATVEGIHLRGGTLLGTSRGGADIKEIVHRIKLWGLNMLFVIGGNGGNAAANAIHEECVRKGVVCSVVGVPKSIDNDILFVDKCFGFETAVDEAQKALLAAKVEARSAFRGLGLVHLMGRQSGFIAMEASMASGVVDICLIPEILFDLDKLVAHMDTIFERQGHCVICVAEGAGQALMEQNGAQGKDASGNPILQDVGKFLSKYLKDRYKKAGKPVDLKYIDPSYMIRSIATVPSDRIYCKILGHCAVHGAFAGYTGFTAGLVNTHYVMLPIPAVISKPRIVNIFGRKWNRLTTAINQPDLSAEGQMSGTEDATSEEEAAETKEPVAETA